MNTNISFVGAVCAPEGAAKHMSVVRGSTELLPGPRLVTNEHKPSFKLLRIWSEKLVSKGCCSNWSFHGPSPYLLLGCNSPGNRSLYVLIGLIGMLKLLGSVSTSTSKYLKVPQSI